MNKVAKTAAATLLAGGLIAGINSCGLGQPDHVTGDRDDVRWSPPRLRTETKTKKVNGRNQTTTKTKTDPAYWCVELDNVNGDKGRDDEWFRVTDEVYEAAKDADEGSSVEFTPLSLGC